MSSVEIVRIIETELADKGIKKAAFYKACDISSATFSQWRSGTYSPSFTALKRIADFLDFKLTFDEDGTASLHSRDISLADEKIKDNLFSDEQLKEMLFGRSEGISDSMLTEVKRYARMILVFDQYEKMQKISEKL